MKTSIASIALVALLSVSAFANPRLSNKSKAKAAPAQAATVQQPFNTQLTFPNALQGATTNSVVVVQYKVDEANRVSNVQVLTSNQQLNDEITRQLTGVKVNTTDADQNAVRTARLRFMVQ